MKHILLFWNCFWFLIKEFNAINFPLINALTQSHKFWYILFSFSFNSKYLLISLVASFLLPEFFRRTLFNFITLGIFYHSPTGLQFNSTVALEPTLCNFNFFTWIKVYFQLRIHLYHLVQYTLFVKVVLYFLLLSAFFGLANYIFIILFHLHYWIISHTSFFVGGWP